MEDRRNVGESSCNFGDGTDQRVQSLMFMMMMMMIIIIQLHQHKGLFSGKITQIILLYNHKMACVRETIIFCDVLTVYEQQLHVPNASD